MSAPPLQASSPVPARRTRMAADWRLAWRRLSALQQAALTGLAVATVVALLAPVITPYDPYLVVASPFEAPSTSHPFGTDEIGRDLLSRVLVGIRLTWFPALAVIAAGALVGTTLGLLAGALGGWVDTVLQRLTDLFLVLPSTLLAVAVVAALGPGLRNTMVAIALFWWPWYSRIVRGEIRAIAARPHIEAARLSGVSRRRLLLRHELPGAVPSIVVTATLDVGNVILIVALFSFVGLGAPAPTPELGAMTARTLSSLTSAWWLPLFPATVIFLLALISNIAGDGVRKALRTI